VTDPKRSLRVPVSLQAEASVSASSLFCPRLSPLSSSEFRVLFLSLWIASPRTPYSNLSVASFCLSQCLSPSVSLRFFLVSLPLPLSLRCPCLQVSGPLQTFRSSPWVPFYWMDDKREGGPRSSLPAPSAPQGLPRPSRLGPISPACSHLVSLAGAAAAAAIYARRSRGRSFKQRFPGARRGPARSLMAPMAASHSPLPPPPRPAPPVLLRSIGPRRPGSHHS
jgi:hypothetical protein